MPPVCGLPVIVRGSTLRGRLLPVYPEDKGQYFFNRLPADQLYCSAPSPETDCNIVLIHNDRHLAGSSRIFQHIVQSGGVCKDIHVGHAPTLLCIGFTSRFGVRSGIFAENQYFFCHAVFLLYFAWCMIFSCTWLWGGIVDVFFVPDTGIACQDIKILPAL